VDLVENVLNGGHGAGQKGGGATVARAQMENGAEFAAVLVDSDFCRFTLAG
jgi:hypothetical protein